MKKTRCPSCGKTGFEPATYAARRDLDGRRFTGNVPARRCTSCGELLISGPGLGAFERAITLELARGGEVGPEGFRWLRKAAGLKAVRLAELLDITPMQVSRWENGRKPLERRAVALVSALVLEQVEGKAATRAVLEALAARKKVPKSVRLDVKRLQLSVQSMSCSSDPRTQEGTAVKEIPAKLVAELRARTGAGMMDCKKALEEADGDLEKAIDILRQKGSARADKRAGREASEGLIGSYVHHDGGIAALVELNCETDSPTYVKTR